MNKKHLDNYRDIDEIATRMYMGGMSLTKVAKELNLDRGSLSNRLKSRGVNIVADCGKKYNLDEDYFKIIDSEGKAYWLGFLLADGNLSRTDNGKHRYVVELSLQRKDRNHLEKFLSDINSDYQIYEKTVYLKQTEREYYASRICLFSKQLHTDLCDKGCTPSKSLVVKYPHNIPHKLNKHLIRGYFDGNGSYRLNKSKNKIIGVRFHSGSEDFLIGLSEIIYNSLGIESSVFRNRTCFDLCFHKLSEINSIINYMYKNSSISLDRKYKIYALNCPS